MKQTQYTCCVNMLSWSECTRMVWRFQEKMKMPLWDEEALMGTLEMFLGWLRYSFLATLCHLISSQFLQVYDDSKTIC
jgi:hypothetical protein